MNQDFTVKKKQYLSEKKFVERDYSHEKKIPAQAVSEKKISCKLKIPHPAPPLNFSNGPSLIMFCFGADNLSRAFMTSR